MNAAGYITVFASVLFFSGIFCIRIYIKTRQLKKETQLLEQQYHNYRDQYTVLKRQIKVTQKYRHDLHNHLRLIQQLSERAEISEELDDYQNYLKEHPLQLEIGRYCGQPVLDVLFFEKTEECRRKCIRLELHVATLVLGRITDMDMALVLFNLFDNGIESCCKESRPEQRFFYMESMAAAGYIVIKTVNTKASTQNPSRKYKKSRLFHGLGMGIMEEIANRYEGSVICEENAQQFQTTVRMKYK